MTGESHREVASYALGVLDERDAEQFEEHLATCTQCIEELESFLPVVDLLAEVDGRDLLVVERADPHDALFDRVVAAVGAERRRARSRRLYSLAASVVLLAMVTGLALFVGTRVGGPQGTTAQPPATSTPSARGSSVPGIGGPDLPKGERFSVTDRSSGVQADLIVASTPFGTGVSFALSKLTGPRKCQLVLLRKDGPPEVISSWKVPPAGYGTAAQPRPLTLQATTVTPLDEIDQMQVQVIDDDGKVTSELVTVPL
ncbi:anti-sigma factor family protein [Plantactinospora solaniradicis]|uniref:Anti-sigma factor family protein n=1 Tax=Plantactinospora solaniradicis TaxID=1723736 RepID=A0ABW1K5K8_9ACTN